MCTDKAAQAMLQCRGTLVNTGTAVFTSTDILSEIFNRPPSLDVKPRTEEMTLCLNTQPNTYRSEN